MSRIAGGTDDGQERGWRRRVAVGGVAVVAILVGGGLALLASGRDGTEQPLVGQPTPTPTAEVGVPVESPAVAPSPTLAATPEPTATPAPPPDTDTWIGPERIATRDYGELSLVVDDEGIAHAAAELDHAIYYLTNATGSWTREPLSTPPAGGHDGAPQIVLDRDGSLAVAFVRFGGWECELGCYPVHPDGVYVATNAPGAWQQPSRVPIEYGGGWSSGVSLAVLDGAVHVAYGIAGEAESAIWYATNTGGSWIAERVDPEQLADELWPWGPNLALAADGTPRIAFTTQDGLRYATAASPRGSFSVERWPDVAGQSVHLLALDATGQLHVVYREGEDGALLYTGWRDDGWTPPEPAFPGTDAMAHPCEGSSKLHVVATDVAVSSRGTVHLISENDLLFAGLWHSASGGGQFEALHLRPPDPWDVDYCNVADFNPNRPATIAVDSLGRPHILFIAAATEDLPLGGARELWYAIGPGD